jgi:hypothetical protein
MTTNSLSESDIKWLAAEAKRCDDKSRTAKEGVFSYAARREAAQLLLNMNGYKMDYDKGQAYKEKGNVRTYVS